ncbi:MAG: Type 1 glutamine amidotransferase-like domain-containing protein [Microthrixaceae bacterium]
MSGTLALLGGGEWTDGVTLDARLAAEAAEAGGGAVTILPAATAYENPGARLDRAREVFAGLGVDVRVLEVYQRSQASDPRLVREAGEAGWLYLTGGSPMHLRSVLYQTPLWEAIHGAFQQGSTLVAAGEAGSVLCDAMGDPRGGAFTVGLNMIDTLSVLPHYEHWSEETLHRTVRLAPAGLPVVGLDARTALVRAPEGTWDVEGPGRVAVFVDGHPAEVSDLPARLRRA